MKCNRRFAFALVLLLCGLACSLSLAILAAYLDPPPEPLFFEPVNCAGVYSSGSLAFAFHSISADRYEVVASRTFVDAFSDDRMPLRRCQLPRWINQVQLKEGRQLTTIAAGLPFRCLVGQSETSQIPYAQIWSAGLLQHKNIGMIPIKPIWLGLAGDVVIFSGIILLSHRAVRRVIALRRRAACRCTHCGYSLAAQACNVCPECGHASTEEVARVIEEAGGKHSDP